MPVMAARSKLSSFASAAVHTLNLPSVLFFEVVSQIALAGLELCMQLRMTLNTWFFFFFFPAFLSQVLGFQAALGPAELCMCYPIAKAAGAASHLSPPRPPPPCSGSVAHTEAGLVSEDDFELLAPWPSPPKPWNCKLA